MIRLESWNEYKNVLDEMSMATQYLEYVDRYFLFISRGSVSFFHILLRETPKSSDETDFETNYKAPENNVPLGFRNIITDGSNDVGVTADRLKTDAQFSTSAQSGFTYDSNYRVDWSNTEVSLNPVSQSYTQLYNYSGTGKLHEFVFDFDSDSVLIKLEVDGNTIFDIDGDMLDSIFSSGEGSATQGAFCLSWNPSNNRIRFTPSLPIKFSSSVTVSSKANSSSTSRDMQRYFVCITKDS